MIIQPGMATHTYVLIDTETNKELHSVSMDVTFTVKRTNHFLGIYKKKYSILHNHDIKKLKWRDEK